MRVPNADNGMATIEVQILLTLLVPYLTTLALNDVYADGKRMNADKTDRKLADEQWEIAKHYPFVPKDPQKRTCSKALVMTHAYSNAIMDKIEEAVKNGLVGNEDDDW